MRRTFRALVADLLTITRAGLAVLVIPAIWSGRLELAALIVSMAWLTDFLDGRLARMASDETRMGPWDLTVDTLFGAGLLVGLAGAHVVPVLFAVVAIVALGGWFVTGNPTASMLLQLAGFLPLLRLLWLERPDAWWLPFLTAALIGLADWRRLLTINIPLFLRGLIGRTPGGPGQGRLQ